MARRIGLALGIALGVVLLVLLTAFGLAQTGAGQRLIAAQVERALSGPDGSAELAGLEGLLPFDVRLRRLALADADGAWLELEDLRLAWSLRALLGGRLVIDEASAGVVRLLRLPPSAPEEASDEPFRLPELPESLPPVELRRLAVERIELGPAVLGEPSSFTLAGNLTAAADGRSAVLALSARRLDEASAEATIAARLMLDPAALELDAHASETGGLLAALSGRPEAGELTLRLKGAGPLADWHGDLEIDAAGLASAEAALDLALAEHPTLRLDATLRPEAQLVPAELAPLLGERLGVTLTASQTAAQHVVVRDLAVAIAAATLTGNGEVDFDSGRLQAGLALRVPDLAPLGDALDTPLEGALQADLAAAGELLQPSGRLRVVLDAPALDPVGAQRLETTLEFAAFAPLGGPQIAVEVTADGRAESLRLPPEVPLPAQDVTWHLVASGAPDGPVTLSELRLAAAPLEVTANGELDATTLAGKARIGLTIAALAPLTEPFGQRLDGRLALTADVHATEDLGEVTVDLSGGAAELAGLPPAAAGLLGPAPKLAAAATFRPGQKLEVSRLALDGAALGLGGQLALSLPEQGLDGALTLRLPALAALDPRLAGALEVVAQPAGTLDAPTLELRASGNDLLLAGRAIERLTLRATAQDLLSAPAGHLATTLVAAGVEASLAADYGLQGGTLAVSDLQLTAPGTRLGGDLAVDLERTLIDGALRGEVADLAAFAPLLPMTLAGRLTLAATLAPAGERQNVGLTVDGSSLGGDFGSLESLSLRAQVADALAAPQLDANLRLGAFRQGDTVVDNATLGARGGLEQLTLTLAADGLALKEFALDGRAVLALGDALRLRLERLDGEFADEPLRLAAPAELTLGDAGTRLAGLDLRLGDARLQATADLGPQQVSAAATLAGLPLPLLGRFGGPPLVGEAAARLQLSGAADNPRGTLELAIENLRAEGLAFAELPPARLDATARLAERRVSLDLQSEGVTEQPMTLTAEVPLIARLDQLVFEVPPDGRLRGQLDAELALARLVALAGLDDQTLSGLMSVHASVGGTVGAPRLQGMLDLAGGAYANGETGTVLGDITLNLQATAQQVTIERFSATDGGSGRLSATGFVGIDPAAGFPLDLRLDLAGARLVRREDVTATLSGGLQLGGDSSAMRLAGNLVVDRADIQIPDQTGPSVAVIKVEEVGIDGREIATPERGRDALALTLDLAVDLPGRVFVRGRGLESEWQGKLQVTGPLSSPGIVGELRIRRGHLDFLDRRLQLGEGVISFGGASPPDPTIRLEARSTVNTTTIVVRLEGRALQPTLTLDSEPPLPQDEVLALLLFQRETSRMTPAQAAQLALAVNRLRGGGAGLLGRARAVLGVDTLDFAGGETAAESTVRAGKYLNDDVYVELERGAASGTGRARVEVEILPNVSLQADTGADAQSGVGIQWRFDY